MIFFKKKPIYRKLILSFLWVWLGFFVSLWFSWHLLSKVDFGYPFWYEYGGVKENISSYAPQNRTHHNFEKTTKAARLELFHQITMAIQMPPEQARQKLKSLTYTVGKELPFLHEQEIIHLVDVSILLQKLQTLGFVLAISWLLLTGLMLMYRIFPSLKHNSIFILSVLSIAGVILMYVGTEKVFYKVHEWVFPVGHPYFFYYQDSLMTTMMNAPLLFAQIAVLLLLVSVFILFSFWKVLSYIFARKACKAI